MEPWKRLLLENKAWAQDAATQPVSEASDGTSREFLWIGCSDARLPAAQMTGSTDGELFVHRNLGNLVVHTDLNLLAVLECAVTQGGVKHIIVCGHFGCQGVRSALDRQSHGHMDAWLNHIKDTWRTHKDELALHEPEAAQRRLVELNVLQQVNNLARTAIVQRTWAAEQRPMLHGWVFDPADRLIRPLVKVDRSTPLDDIHRLAGPIA
ncbi:MAG: carbonic anhydrase [Myxococcota bacterium]